MLEEDLELEVEVSAEEAQLGFAHFLLGKLAVGDQSEPAEGVVGASYGDEFVVPLLVQILVVVTQVDEGLEEVEVAHVARSGAALVGISGAQVAVGPVGVHAVLIVGVAEGRVGADEHFLYVLRRVQVVRVGRTLRRDLEEGVASGGGKQQQAAEGEVADKGSYGRFHCRSCFDMVAMNQKATWMPNVKARGMG